MTQRSSSSNCVSWVIGGGGERPGTESAEGPGKGSAEGPGTGSAEGPGAGCGGTADLAGGGGTKVDFLLFFSVPFLFFFQHIISC